MTTIQLDSFLPLIMAFIFTATRLSGIFLLAPVFSSPMVPARIKLMMMTALAAMLTPVITATSTVVVPDSGIILLMLLVKELIIGLAIGFSVSLIFTAVQFGASLIDLSIGFSLANIVDPLGGNNSSVIGSFYSLVATLAFLSVNAHEWLLSGFVRSFRLIPLMTVPSFNVILDNIVTIFVQLFVVGFQVAAPVLVALLLTDVVLGIVARVVPQMNVFFVGIPFKIGVGLVALILALPGFMSLFESRISDVINDGGVLTGSAPITQTRGDS